MQSDKPSIHQKLCDIQNELLECDIKKSGYNPFGKFSYYELKDILPPILRLCKKHNCNIYFLFIEKFGILKFFTNDGQQEISTRMVIPELQQLPRSTLIQSEGAYQTYAKKYLLMNLFCISESDIIDGENLNENGSQSKPSNKKSDSKKSPKKEPKSTDAVLGWNKLIEYCKNENPNLDSFDTKTLKKARFRMTQKGLLDAEETEALYNYLETLK